MPLSGIASLCFPPKEEKIAYRNVMEDLTRREILQISLRKGLGVAGPAKTDRGPF